MLPFCNLVNYAIVEWYCSKDQGAGVKNKKLLERLLITLKAVAQKRLWTRLTPSQSLKEEQAAVDEHSLHPGIGARYGGFKPLRE